VCSLNKVQKRIKMLNMLVDLTKSENVKSLTKYGNWTRKAKSICDKIQYVWHIYKEINQQLNTLYMTTTTT